MRSRNRHDFPELLPTGNDFPELIDGRDFPELRPNVSALDRDDDIAEPDCWVSFGQALAGSLTEAAENASDNV